MHHLHTNQDKVQPVLKEQEQDLVDQVPLINKVLPDQVQHINLEHTKEPLELDTKVQLVLVLAQAQVLLIKGLDTNLEPDFLQVSQEPELESELEPQAHIDQALALAMEQQSNKVVNQPKEDKLGKPAKEDKLVKPAKQGKAGKVAHQPRVVLLDMEDLTILHIEELEATIDLTFINKIESFLSQSFF